MSVTQFSYNPQSSNPANYSTQLDGFNAEMGARLTDLELFGSYLEARTGDPSAQSLWVSGTSYSDGDTVYSPTDLLPYRANKDIANSTTDPNADGGTDWDGAGGIAAADLTKLGYMTVTEVIDLDISQDRVILTANGSITAGELLVLEDAGTVKGVTPSPTDADDWVGFAAHSAADGQDVIVNTAGDVDENQSGLTIGSTYYADDDGTLTISDTGRKIGKAVAADKLYITERRA